MATILVVDDDRLTTEALTVLLQNAEHVVLPALTGNQALRWLENVRPELVLLDLTMPGLDGIGLLWKLNQDPLTRSVPIVILTGNPGALNDKKPPSNVAQVLVKPQDPPAILGAITKALGLPR